MTNSTTLTNEAVKAAYQAATAQIGSFTLDASLKLAICTAGSFSPVELQQWLDANSMHAVLFWRWSTEGEPEVEPKPDGWKSLAFAYHGSVDAKHHGCGEFGGYIVEHNDGTCSTSVGYGRGFDALAAFDALDLPIKSTSYFGELDKEPADEQRARIELFDSTNGRISPYVNATAAEAEAKPEVEPKPAPDDLPRVVCKVEKHRHTKKQFDYWLCVPADKVERAEFERLRDYCKASDGWYSRKFGKIPGGYAFDSEAGAEAFAEAVKPADAAEIKVETYVSKPEVEPEAVEASETSTALTTVDSTAVQTVDEPEAEKLPEWKQGSFLIDRLSFKRALQRLADTAPKKSPKSVLESVKVCVNGHCQLSATDLEQWHDEYLEAEKQGDGELIVNARRLKQVVDKSRTDQLTVEVWSESLRVAGAVLPATDDVDSYPAPLSITSGEFAVLASWSGSASELASMIERTVYATDTESSRYALGALLVEFSKADDKLTLVGTDGRRLAVARHGATIEADDMETGLLGASFAKSAVKALKAGETATLELTRDADDIVRTVDDEPVMVRDGNGKATDEPLRRPAVLRLTVHGNSAVSSYVYRQMDGRFPKWRDVIPKPELLGEIDAKAFFGFATTVESFGTEGRCEVEFGFENGLLTASADNEAGLFSDHTDIRSNEGERFDVCLDSRYMLDFAKSVKACSESVRLYGTDSDSPMLLQADNALCVLMPLSRDRVKKTS
jgi:DNA polymerase-3 subunit beta